MAQDRVGAQFRLGYVKIPPVMREAEIFGRTELLEILPYRPYQRHLVHVRVVLGYGIAFRVRKLDAVVDVPAALHGNINPRLGLEFVEDRRIAAIAYVNFKIIHYIILYGRA